MAILLSSLLIPRLVTWERADDKTVSCPTVGISSCFFGKARLIRQKAVPATDADPSKASGTITG